MPSNHLILCHPLLFLPPIFPSIRVFPNESVFRVRWPEYWSFSFNISLFNEYSGLTSFRIDWLDLLAVQGLSRVSPVPQLESINSSALIRGKHRLWAPPHLEMCMAAWFPAGLQVDQQSPCLSPASLFYLIFFFLLPTGSLFPFLSSHGVSFSSVEKKMQEGRGWPFLCS